MGIFSREKGQPFNAPDGLTATGDLSRYVGEIMFDNSIITKTKQMWKLKLTFLLTIIGGLALFYGIHMINKDAQSGVFFPFILGGIALGLGSLFFGSLFVRCPKCKKRWLWEAISKKSSNNWLQWLLSQPACPSCNYEEK